jgi:hypothetical protein
MNRPADRWNPFKNEFDRLSRKVYGFSLVMLGGVFGTKLRNSLL